MLADLKRYPAMKNSGVQWLAEVPEHWEVRRLKHVCSLRSGEGITAEAIEPQGEFPVYGGNGWRGFTSAFTHDGEFPLIGRQGALCGNVHLASGRFWASEHAVVASPARECDSKWLAHALRVMDLRQHSIAAAQPGLAVERILTLPICLPPLPEQAAIVRFLDHADRQIRRYIRAKQKLIKLLEEQKQAIIHRAVTRGLNPDVRLKPSGVEWLGAVPEHWEVKKLKHLTRFHNGLAFKPSDWSSTGVPIIRIQNLNGSDGFNFTLRSDLPEFLRIRPGDLLFSWSGNRGTSFGSFIWDRDFEGYLNQHIFKLDGYTLDRAYFAYLLRAVTRHVEEQTHGIIGLVHITKPALGAILVPVAPPEEQSPMARSLDEQTAGLRRLTERAEREMTLLHEYRTRLIADVVTGKLDVRAAAASLPGDEFADTEVLEPDDEPLEYEDAAEEELAAELEEAEV